MDEPYRKLADALRARTAIIGDERSRQNPEAHLARLQEVSERLEAAERELPPAIDPQLRHYLQRRSYSKALEFLEQPA